MTGSADFFTVPTVTGRILFVFFVLLHHRRRVVYLNVDGASNRSLDRARHGAGEFGIRHEDCVYMTETGPKGFAQPTPF